MKNEVYKQYLIAAIPGLILSLGVILFFGKLFEGIINLLLELKIAERQDGLPGAVLLFAVMVSLTLALSASSFQLLMFLQKKEKISLTELSLPFIFPGMFLAIPIYAKFINLLKW